MINLQNSEKAALITFFNCYPNEVESALENLTPTLRLTAFATGCLWAALTPPIFLIDQTIVRAYRYLNGQEEGEIAASLNAANILFKVAFYISSKND
jgi:hypothetical protein